jgi:hypothetical protein
MVEFPRTDFTCPSSPVAGRIKPNSRISISGTGAVITALRGLRDINAFALYHTGHDKNNCRQPSYVTADLLYHGTPPCFYIFEYISFLEIMVWKSFVKIYRRSYYLMDFLTIAWTILRFLADQQRRAVYEYS